MSEPVILNNVDLPTYITYYSNILYIISEGTIQKLDLNNNNTITEFYSGLVSPNAITVDTLGNVYCNDGTNIRKITPQGFGTIYYNNNPSLIDNPSGLAFDSLGNLYCSNYSNQGNIIKIINGPTVSGLVLSTTGVPLSNVNKLVYYNNDLYCASTGNNIYKITLDENNTVSIFNDNNLLNVPIGTIFDNDGNMYCANFVASNILKITDLGTNTSVFASQGLNGPYDVAFNNNYLYVSNFSGNNILQFSLSPVVTTVITTEQSEYTVINGVIPFNLNAQSNSTATIVYSSSDEDIVDVNQNGDVTIFNTTGETPVIITLYQAAIDGYTEATATVTINVTASSSSNPTPITDSADLIYFLNSVNSSLYGGLQNNININTELTTSNPNKIIINNTNNNINIVFQPLN